MSRISSIALALAVASTAAAQDSAVESAADAFGERVGTEQSGLYSESQVRGFDLNDSGAYRIDDAYFSRAAALNDPVLAGVGVRVGVNAVRLAYPAPSGDVNHHMHEERLLAFGTLYQREYDGDFAIVPAESAVLPSPEKLQQHSPSWAESEAMNSNLGVLYDARFGDFTL